MTKFIEKRKFRMSKYWDSTEFTLMQNEETKLYFITSRYERWIMATLCKDYAANTEKKLCNFQESVLGYSIPNIDEHFPYCKTQKDTMLLFEELCKERLLREQSLGAFIPIKERLLSNSLQNALFEIGSVTAYKLLMINRNKKCGKDDTKNVTVLRNGKMTFSPKGKETICANDYEWSKEGRQSAKYGKVILKLFKEANIEVTAREIEVITNKLKAKYDPIAEFSIVTGSDITKWYLEDNYCNETNTGTLVGSCMKYDHCQDYFGLYEDHASMLIAVSKESGKLLGRAILWEIDGKTYVDRIYASDAMIEKFKQYAKENKWYYKVEQSYNNKTDWINPDGEEETIYLTVDIDYDYDYFPYVDTLTYYKKGQYITNDESKDYDFELTDTEGNGQRIYCEYDGSYCSEECAVYICDDDYEGYIDSEGGDAEYCEITNDWHLRENMITTEGGTRVYRNDDGVVEGEDGLYYYDDEASYCDYNGGWFSSSQVHWNEDLSMDVHEHYLEAAYEEYGWVKDEDGNWVKESQLNTETTKS